jgi:hypothetical protein
MYLLDTSLTGFVRDLLQSVVPRHAKQDIRSSQEQDLYYQYVSQRSGTDDVKQEQLPFLAIGGMFLITATILYAVAE